jgi:hypothetical protein
MKILYGTITVILVLVICSSFFSLKKKKVDYEKIADRITGRTMLKIEKERNLVFIGFWGGMMHNIRLMSMSFQYYQEVDFDQARELLLYAVDTYLEEINKDQEVRPYLVTYPFTAENVEIHIWFYGPDRRRLPYGKIDYVLAANGTFMYDSSVDKFTSKMLSEETYEEAKQKVAIKKAAKELQ